MHSCCDTESIASDYILLLIAANAAHASSHRAEVLQWWLVAI